MLMRLFRQYAHLGRSLARALRQGVQIPIGLHELREPADQALDHLRGVELGAEIRLKRHFPLGGRRYRMR